MAHGQQATRGTLRYPDNTTSLLSLPTGALIHLFVFRFGNCFLATPTTTFPDVAVGGTVFRM